VIVRFEHSGGARRPRAGAWSPKQQSRMHKAPRAWAALEASTRSAIDSAGRRVGRIGAEEDHVPIGRAVSRETDDGHIVVLCGRQRTEDCTRRRARTNAN
jgi:hypothetical protein